MKITCDKNLLSEVVNNVGKAIPIKSTISVLDGILLTAKKNKLFLYGYNLELLISTSINVNVIEEGSILVNFKIFSELIKKMSCKNIEITKVKNSINVKDENTNCNIIGYDIEEYPDLPETNGEEVFSIKSFILKNMINETIFSVSTNDQKPVHTGILFEIQNENISLVTVDGFRLSIRNEKCESKNNDKFVIPAKTMNETSKLIKENEQNIIFEKLQKNIIIKFDNYTIVSRLIDGEFLDYKNVINKENKSIVTINTKDFYNAIDRTSLIINDRTKNPIIINFIDKETNISCCTQLGEIKEKVLSKKNGDDVKIGFNHKYLLDALKICEDEDVQIQLKDELSPIKIIPIKGDKFLYLILPVRLKNE